MPRVTPDANDVLVWNLNDGPTFNNTGTAGSSGNWSLNGHAIPGTQGLFGPALYVPGPLAPDRCGAGGANDNIVPIPLTLSGWVFLRYYPNNYTELFEKQYFLNGWSYPYLSFGIQLVNTADGTWDFYLTIPNQSLQYVRNGTNFAIPVGRWSHIGGTYDGTTLITYLNGSPCNSSAISGSVDYGTIGNRGQWYVGGIPSGPNQEPPAMFQDIRVANVIRPASYFANIYYQGVQSFT